jgi:hypothetical protein
MLKNRFDGLRFRVMEQLEKAKGVPLTAREVAQRLHEAEYSDQLFDTVLFRAGNAIHALKGKGQVLQHDARGAGGQLTYVLPQRMAFSLKKDDTPPANPVLKADIAEKIVTTAKKEPEPPKRPIYATGVPEMVVEALDKAEYPLAAPEIMDIIGDPWKGHYVEEDKRMVLAGVIYGLFKERRIRRVSSSKRVPRVQYEYFTNKTKSKVAPPLTTETVPVKAYVEVPPKNKKLIAETRKPKRQTEQAQRQAVIDEQDTSKPLFRPGAKPAKDFTLNIRIAQTMHNAWQSDAQRFGVSLTQFVIDAVEFARGYAGDE